LSKKKRFPQPLLREAQSNKKNTNLSSSSFFSFFLSFLFSFFSSFSHL